MTKLSEALHKIIHNLSWEEEWFQEEVTEKELKQVAKIAKMVQRMYEAGKDKETMLAKFIKSNHQYINSLDRERKESQYVAKTKNGKPILYARFEKDYKINPTKASDYLNQYKL